MKVLNFFLKQKMRRQPTMFIILVICFCIIIYTHVKIREYKALTRKLTAERLATKHKQHQSVLKLRKTLRTLNKAEHIINLDKFGVISKEATIFLVMVKDNIQYLKHLMYSLSKVKGIEKSLIVLSHSYYDENINSFVKSVNFSSVMQMFYPYSLQVYPNEFPGPQGDDCPEFIDVNKAIEINCTGANYPDIKGNFRNAASVERKLHWWWSANRFFEELICTAEHKGLVVFLDDYNYLSEDFLYTLDYMKMAVTPDLSHNEIFGFGGFSNLNITYKKNLHCRANLRVWNPSYSSQAIAFNVSTWKSISAQYDSFCDVDDYTWKRSLYYISLNRKDGHLPFRAFYSSYPKVFDIRECNVTTEWHVRDKICNVTENVAAIKRFLKNSTKYMYPPRLDVVIKIELFSAKDTSDVNNSGGWSYPKDKEFCRNITVDKAKKVHLDEQLKRRQHSQVTEETMKIPPRRRRVSPIGV